MALEFKLNPPYFNLSEAFDEVVSEFKNSGAIKGGASVAKLAGKTVANTGMLVADGVVDGAVFTINNPVEVAGKIAAALLKTEYEGKTVMTDEKREKFQESVKHGDEARKEREQREREERLNKS